ncbi:MAG: MarR family winged helix-turn-helix transcriptional regulator [Candidatus Dormibacteria bacterium]
MQDNLELTGLSRQEREALVDKELRRATTAIDGLDQRAAAVFGVNRTDLRLLDLLAARGPMTIGELGRAAGLSSGGMTIALDRLEEAQYLRREPNPKDRRSHLLQVTERIGAPSAQAFGPLQARMAAVLTTFGKEELEVLSRFLGSWADAIEATLESGSQLSPGAESSKPDS